MTFESKKLRISSTARKRTCCLHSTASCMARRRVQCSAVQGRPCRPHALWNRWRLLLLPSVSSLSYLLLLPLTFSLSISRLILLSSNTSFFLSQQFLALSLLLLAFIVSYGFPSSTFFHSFLSSLLLLFVYCFLRFPSFLLSLAFVFLFPSFFISFFGYFFPSLFIFSFLTSSLFY
jgi:hypothetical protein